MPLGLRQPLQSDAQPGRERGRPHGAVTVTVFGSGGPGTVAVRVGEEREASPCAKLQAGGGRENSRSASVAAWDTAPLGALSFNDYDVIAFARFLVSIR
jgi:hypothetical protein